MKIHRGFVLLAAALFLLTAGCAGEREAVPSGPAESAQMENEAPGASELPSEEQETEPPAPSDSLYDSRNPDFHRLRLHLPDTLVPVGEHREEDFCRYDLLTGELQGLYLDLFLLEPMDREAMTTLLSQRSGRESFPLPGREDSFSLPLESGLELFCRYWYDPTYDPAEDRYYLTCAGILPLEEESYFLLLYTSYTVEPEEDTLFLQALFQEIGDSILIEESTLQTRN